MARQLDKDSRDVKNIFLALKLSEFWGVKDAAAFIAGETLKTPKAQKAY